MAHRHTHPRGVQSDGRHRYMTYILAQDHAQSMPPGDAPQPGASKAVLIPKLSSILEKKGPVSEV